MMHGRRSKVTVINMSQLTKKLAHTVILGSDLDLKAIVDSTILTGGCCTF